MPTLLGILVPICLLQALTLLVSPLSAQAHRGWVSVGPGSLSPDDPFIATLSFRGALGWITGSRNAYAFEYIRQSANRSEGSDLGKYSRNYYGLAWQHAFRDAFDNDEEMKQQYFLQLGAGFLTRGVFRGVAPAQHLSTAGFIDAGASIRYPFTQRLAAVGTIDDVLAFLPHQIVTSPSTTYEFGGKVQHNFGLFVALQWRL